jgi:hypothetical protein
VAAEAAPLHPAIIRQETMVKCGGVRDERLRKKKGHGQSKVGRQITITGARGEPTREAGGYHRAQGFFESFPDMMTAMNVAIKRLLVWIEMLKDVFLRKESSMTPSPVSPSSSSPQANSQDHPLACLVLHLLPARPPGLTERELVNRIHQAMHMTQVRPTVVSALLARLEQAEQIASRSDGSERCYWRLGPVPGPSK